MKSYLYCTIILSFMLCLLSSAIVALISRVWEMEGTLHSTKLYINRSQQEELGREQEARELAVMIGMSFFFFFFPYLSLRVFLHPGFIIG